MLPTCRPWFCVLLQLHLYFWAYKSARELYCLLGMERFVKFCSLKFSYSLDKWKQVNVQWTDSQTNKARCVFQSRSKTHAKPRFFWQDARAWKHGRSGRAERRNEYVVLIPTFPLDIYPHTTPACGVTYHRTMQLWPWSNAQARGGTTFSPTLHAVVQQDFS